MGRKEWLSEARSFGWFLNYAGLCYLFTDYVSYIILDKDCPRAVKSTRLVVFDRTLDTTLLRSLKMLLLKIPIYLSYHDRLPQR